MRLELFFRRQMKELMILRCVVKQRNFLSTELNFNLRCAITELKWMGEGRNVLEGLYTISRPAKPLLCSADNSKPSTEDCLNSKYAQQVNNSKFHVHGESEGETDGAPTLHSRRSFHHVRLCDFLSRIKTAGSIVTNIANPPRT